MVVMNCAVSCGFDQSMLFFLGIFWLLLGGSFCAFYEFGESMWPGLVI
jgi:hypothetical protein